jgi:ferredoxin
VSDLILRVNPILCDAHGLCAELLPERIQLDEWGYPMIDETPISPTLEAYARRAVDACPVLALRLERRASLVSRAMPVARDPLPTFTGHSSDDV